jgi:hypothetical protein
MPNSFPSKYLGKIQRSTPWLASWQVGGDVEAVQFCGCVAAKRVDAIN